MGADNIKYADGKFAKAVFVKGGSSNPLVFKGTVTTATSSTVFASTDLTGHGNDAFINDWYVYVFHDAGGAGAAPQGEYRLISDYVSSTGTFTHTSFSADLALTDEVFIVHSSIADKVGGEYTGTVSAGTAAKTLIKEITTSTRVEIKGIWLDLTLLVTAGATIELEHKIDGSTYRVFETDSWALTDDDGVFITGTAINNDFKISITGGEAAGVNIPYNIIYQNME